MIETRPDRTLGPGHDIFWDWCNKGELRLQLCIRCGHITWPVTQTCEECGHSALVWERMSGTGTLASWCRFERDYYRGLMPVPYETILVELAEGPLFISNPIGFGDESFVMGAPVTLRFVDCEDSAGRFCLPVFVLV
jgi:uncharacterized protein